MSLTDQLDHGIRGLELDIHDEFNVVNPYSIIKSLLKRLFKKPDNFWVGHYWAGAEVDYLGGNPFFLNNNFESWLKVIVKWSLKNEDHSPITIFLDVKGDFTDSNNKPSQKYGLKRLNQQILNSFGFYTEKLYTYEQYLADKQLNEPLTNEKLKNKIILVLMSYYASEDNKARKIMKLLALLPKLVLRVGKRAMNEQWGDRFVKTRIKYLKEKQICFPSFNPVDIQEGPNSKFLENSLFVTLPLTNVGMSKEIAEQNRIIRPDYSSESIEYLQYINFPAIDNYKDSNYDKYQKWIKK